MLTDYHEALRLTRTQTFNWGEETIPLAKAGNRILAEPLLTDRPQPPYDRVTMDGIAIDYAAYAGGRREFPVAGIVAAGAVPLPLADPATCLEVMTGAVRPSGSTTIIRYEDLERVGRSFRLPEDVVDGKNIHAAGSDAARGVALLSPGVRIGGAAINLLASCGFAEVLVKRLPRVAIVATGDELVGVGETPLPHQIRMSNVHHLGYELSTIGIDADAHHLADDVATLKAAIYDLLNTTDVVIFSGGVSKGRYDHLPEVLADLGVRRLFHRVAQRPGKPIWVGRTDGTMVFGLPGNPVSSLVGMQAYVKSFLRENLGVAERLDKRELGAEFSFKPELTLFQICRIDADDQRAYPVAGGGSGDGSSMLRGDGVLVLPRRQQTFRVGERYAFLAFG